MGSESTSRLRGLLPGSFNPLHEGHLQLKGVAEQQLEGPVAFELAVVNVEKPALDQQEIVRRCGQFSGQPLAVTNTPTFAEKSQLFPGLTFVVGADTAARVVSPRFYNGDDLAMDRALSAINERRCRFLVAARLHAGRLLTLEDVPTPHRHRELFEAIPAECFRLDISSTMLRKS